MWKSSLFLLAFLTVSIKGKHFRLGHSHGGNLGAPAEYDGEPLPKAQWFEQKLDHFSRTNMRTWSQRFFINDTFFDIKNAGPVFLMIGGEGTADPRWMVKGNWIDYAKHFGALCVMLEHRYYGESRPTSDMSIKNLVYLSSEQALADLANFIHFANQHYVPKGAKWILFGGSYPGSLAAWMRLKFPHLVYGAVSSSAPLLAQVDFQRYFGVVVEALTEKTGNEDCVNQIKQGHKEIKDLMSSNPEVIEKEFRVCKPFSEATSDDIKNFYSSIANEFARVVQYNEDNRFNVNENTRNTTINIICDVLTDPSKEPAYKKLGKFNSIILEQSNQTCLDYSYTKMCNDLRNSSWDADVGRQWIYQTCTEFGFYQTSTGEVDAFGNDFPINFFSQQCEDIFGKKFNKKFIYQAAEWTNTMYGALNISASRIVYVHGSVDPWHALGITDPHQVSGKDSGVIFVKGTAHCANMYPSSPRDLPSLIAARIEVARYLSAWLEP